MKWINEKENLDFLINQEHVSYEEIGRRYNCTGAAVKRAAERLGLNIPQRRKVNPNETFRRGTAKTGICKNCGKEIVLYKSTNGLFCSTKCFHTYKHKENYKRILNGDETIMRANYSPKNFKADIIDEQNGVCTICGCPQEHNGKPLVFILDHIDGDASNNRRENSRCICPNCDSQLDTYKSKNKKSSRNYYRYGGYKDKNPK